MVVYAKIPTKIIREKSQKADFWAVLRVDKKEKRAYYSIKGTNVPLWRIITK